MNDIEELKGCIFKLKKISNVLRTYKYESLKSRIDYMNSEEFAHNPFKVYQEEYLNLEKLEEYIKDLKNIEIFDTMLDDICAILYTEEVSEILEENKENKE